MLDHSFLFLRVCFSLLWLSINVHETSVHTTSWHISQLLLKHNTNPNTCHVTLFVRYEKYIGVFCVYLPIKNVSIKMVLSCSRAYSLHHLLENDFWGSRNPKGGLELSGLFTFHWPTDNGSPKFVTVDSCKKRIIHW